MSILSQEFFQREPELVISFCKIFKISVHRKEILSKWLNIQSFGNNMLILSQPYIHMLLLTGCCYQPGVVTNRLLSPTECYYQQGVVTNQVLLPTRCCYQPGVVTNQVLLPTGCCYQPGVVTNWVLLPTGCCYQLGVVTNWMFLPTGCCYQLGGVANRDLHWKDVLINRYLPYAVMS